MTINEYEDQFWAEMKAGLPDQPWYGVETQKSLFDKDCKVWNLNNLDYKDSIIHKVCILHIFYMS